MSNQIQPGDSVAPIFVTIKQAAQMLGISAWSMYQLADQQKVETRYHGTRRLVRIESLREYADSLPTRPAASGE